MVSEQLTNTDEAEAPVLLKLDLGAGKRPKEGYVAVDIVAFTPETQVVNLVALDDHQDFAGPRRFKPWPWPDNSVGDVHCSHFIEHLDAMERVHFFNELYRVLAPKGTATIVTPMWSSCRAYGDPTHKWPPVSEFGWYYLSRKWRLGVEGSDKPEEGPNAPHTDASFVPGMYDCDFDVQWGYSMDNDLATKNPEYQQFAFRSFVNAAQDMVASVTSLKPV